MIVAEERDAEESRRRARTARTTESVTPRAQSSLAISAAEEYGYVARDVRRIAVVGGSLIAAVTSVMSSGLKTQRPCASLRRTSRRLSGVCD